MTPTTTLSGFSDLKPDVRQEAEQIVQQQLEKIQQRLSGITSIEANLKIYLKAERPSHYEFHVKIGVPRKVFDVKKEEYDLKKLIHKSFDALQNEIEHFLKK